MIDGSDLLSDGDRGKPMTYIASRLVDVLGVRLCAVIGDVEQTRSVREWVDGKEPSVGRARTLRFALRIAETIEGLFGSTQAQSWFQGANCSLGDVSPALELKRACCAGDVEALRIERRVANALFEFLDE